MKIKIKIDLETNLEEQDRQDIYKMLKENNITIQDFELMLEKKMYESMQDLLRTGEKISWTTAITAKVTE